MSTNEPGEYTSNESFTKYLNLKLRLIGDGIEFLGLNLASTDQRLKDAMAGRIAVDPPLSKKQVSRFGMMIGAIGEQQAILKKESASTSKIEIVGA